MSCSDCDCTVPPDGSMVPSLAALHGGAGRRTGNGDGCVLHGGPFPRQLPLERCCVCGVAEAVPGFTRFAGEARRTVHRLSADERRDDRVIPIPQR